MTKKEIRVEDLLDVISKLQSASAVLGKIEQGMNITQAVEEGATGKHRTSFSRFMGKLEKAYGFQILESTGEKGGKRISEDVKASELVNAFQLYVADLVTTKNQLVHLRDTKKVPSVTIGTWIGIGMYLLPAVIKELEDVKKRPSIFGTTLVKLTKSLMA